ncbi:MAG: hypothetical protein SCABRO_00216 [Candidatus Scalindua brodae]|uniref:Uncharacterized protein n=1 Tax=Candidatus Scalindua brodae TaxID=237368 RepID=A0A0B0ELU2_9BACT|nr:MAG: hypothetical protein SCABRO_00216 [Candidatus Scalindua brodae]
MCKYLIYITVNMRLPWVGVADNGVFCKGLNWRKRGWISEA